ncbi:MAG: AAA family ATPase [Planctomycetota bacterium]
MSNAPLDIVESLRLPEAYRHETGPSIELLQTHISWIFFAGERVYKVKKPVDLGFLDYATLERRRSFCIEEVRLNRRLAPDTYLGISAIRRDQRGIYVVDPVEAEDLAADDAVVEYAVAMKRLPSVRMMDRLLESHEVDNAMLSALARKLQAFHAQADRGPEIDAHGRPESIAFNVTENFDQTRERIGDTVSPRLHAALEARARAELERLRPTFEKRLAAGRVCDGHGDLHSGNVCFRSVDDIVIYDCIEFAPRFRSGDVACDLAFLTMDLDLRRLRGFSGYLARRYAELAGDESLLEVEPFYKAYRAMVRAKVTGMKSQGPRIEEAERLEARREAMRYFHLAASYLLPPAVILVCGLPASGKSWAVEPLSTPFEAAVLSSDRTRKRLAGVRESSRHKPGVDVGLYGQEMSDRTYACLLEEAQGHLRDGRSVLVDATFHQAARRAPFAELAKEQGVPLLAVHLDPPEDVILERLERRAKDPVAISDADVNVYRALKERWEPLKDLPTVVHWTDSTRPPEELVAELIEHWLN